MLYFVALKMPFMYIELKIHLFKLNLLIFND